MKRSAKCYKNELKESNLRATPARVATIKLLENTKEPIDTNTIYSYLNKNKIKTDMATVFRIMNILTAKNITTAIYFDDGKARYELANKKHHHHLVCEKCKKIEDISGNFIQSLEKEIGKKHRFSIKRHSLEFYGLCSKCNKTN